MAAWVARCKARAEITAASIAGRIGRDGPVGKRWGTGTDPVAFAIGFADYVFMVDPVRGAELKARAADIRDQQ